MTKIEWTHIPGYKPETWNPTTGCTRVSAGCDHCYAVPMTRRLSGIAATREKYSGLVNEGKHHFNGRVKMHWDSLTLPGTWTKPRAVFVNSMSDLFHEQVSDDFIRDVFVVMGMYPEHIFMILTKRPERLARVLNNLSGYQSEMKTRIVVNSLRRRADGKRVEAPWPLPNVWLGVSVEDQKTADERIPYLLKTPAAVRFLSCEPLLGSLDIRLCLYPHRRMNCPKCNEMHIDYGPHRHHLCMHCGERWDGGDTATGSMEHNEYRQIDWLICGGESGPDARPMHPEWARSLRYQCQEAGVPFFFKQWGEWIDNQNIPFEHITGDYKQYVFNPDGFVAHEVWKIGKRKAGRQLDGVEYNEFPHLRQGFGGQAHNNQTPDPCI